MRLSAGSLGFMRRPFFNSIVRIRAGRIVQIPHRTQANGRRQCFSYELVYNARLETEFDR